ncbi:MAG: Coenzyme F420 hydrogenase/dehydrogenase, beta subunit C-terminal domain [Lachnospiraceae bacterium]|nr:Coenzyme F420 hydrogenase/dehydrogenase, beta subunit C-terminal domain [Lachnospiraceae bacterium]
MNSVNPENGCVGCSACYSICSQKAITMGADNYGFYIPVVDADKCIHCKRCVKVCPLLSNNIERDKDASISKYMFVKNIDQRSNSCSGGVFYALAEYILRQNGIVCGCIWDDTFVAKHVCTEQLETVKKMRGSKYVQSNMQNCFKEIRDYILSGRKVLFCGTGCQTTALKQYIGEKGNDLLVCCAVVCGGIPSPKIWEYYRNFLEKKESSKLKRVEMRDKKHGWLMPEIYVEFMNGKKIREVLLHENLYGVNFGEGLFINESCMKCNFKLNKVNADILLSDDWGINKNRLRDSRNKGSSAVIILTDKGKNILSQIDDKMISYEGNIDDIIDSHHVLTKNHIENKWRKEFFERVTAENIFDLLKYYKIKWEKRVKMPFYIKALYKIRVYSLLYNFKWRIFNK